MRFNNKEQASAYLAGIIDGEGHIAFYTYKVSETRSRGTKRIVITNCDYELIEACIEALDLLDIEYKVREEEIRKTGKLPVFAIFIYKKANFVKIMTEVPLQSNAKKIKLAEMIASYGARQIYKRRLQSGKIIDVKRKVRDH